MYILSKVMFNLSRKELWMEPITLANLSMSCGLYSTQSENRIEIYSDCTPSPVIRFRFILSIELVRHFLKMYWSS
jgi:hypothetical protein